MRWRLAPRRTAQAADCQNRVIGVTTGMAQPANARPSCSIAHCCVRGRRARAAQGAATFLLDRVAEDMADRLAAVMRQFARGGRHLARPASGCDARCAAPSSSGSRSMRPDCERRCRLQPESLDLAVSALALQFVNDLPGVLAQIRRALKPDGLLLAAMIGGDTLTELRQAFAAAEAEFEGGVSPRVAPFADLRDLGALLQRAGFALPVTDVDRVVVRYDNAFALMHDLRRMGATNVLIERRRTPPPRATLLRMAQIYGERFADADGRIRATFDIVWLSGWAPHASQQQPLQPGSAKASLAEAVKRGGRLTLLRLMRHPRATMPRHPKRCSAASMDAIAVRVAALAPRDDGAPSHQQIDQMRDQRNVRRRHRIVAQLVGADPGQRWPRARSTCPSQRRQM